MGVTKLTIERRWRVFRHTKNWSKYLTNIASKSGPSGSLFCDNRSSQRKNTSNFLAKWNSSARKVRSEPNWPAILWFLLLRFWVWFWCENPSSLSTFDSENRLISFSWFWDYRSKSPEFSPEFTFDLNANSKFISCWESSPINFEVDNTSNFLNPSDDWEFRRFMSCQNYSKKL